MSWSRCAGGKRAHPLACCGVGIGFDALGGRMPFRGPNRGSYLGASFVHSPLEQGLYGPVVATCPKGGSIPAPAGSAVFGFNWVGVHRVHPRTCGVRVGMPKSIASFPGSPPCQRGPPEEIPGRVGIVRFIPAPAGSAWASSLRVPGWRVHPRACGVRVDPRDPKGRTYGSSPSARGSRKGEGDPILLERFIPAPAGFALYGGVRLATTRVHPRPCGVCRLTSYANRKVQG